MKADELILVASAGVISGSLVQEKVNLPVVSSNPIFEVGLGAGIALVGFLTHMDGVSDFVESFGIGYAVNALVTGVL